MTNECDDFGNLKSNPQSYGTPEFIEVMDEP